MGPCPVVIGSPPEKDCLRQAEEQCLIEKLIVQMAIEALDRSIQHRLVRRDIVPFDLCGLCPGKNGIRGELAFHYPRQSSSADHVRLSDDPARVTRVPDRDVSATRARHCRVQSSTTVRMRKRRPSVSWSDTKSRGQHSLGPIGIIMGARVSIAHLRPPRPRARPQGAPRDRDSLALANSVTTSFTEDPSGPHDPAWHELAVLILQRPQLFGLRHLHTAKADFHVYILASLTQCLQHSSETERRHRAHSGSR